MEQMNFENYWRSWIVGSMSSATTSIFLNGFPSLEFIITKGVREGNPLSSFLFIIAMKTACEMSIFHGIKIHNNEPTISHLLYDDDSIFVGESSSSNIKNTVLVSTSIDNTVSLSSLSCVIFRVYI